MDYCGEAALSKIGNLKVQSLVVRISCNGLLGFILFLLVKDNLAAFGIVMDSLNSRTMNFGQILNGLGGMMAQTAGPVLSSAWFPPNERITATALSSLSCPLGVALSFIIGPLVIYDRPLDFHDHINTTLNSAINSTANNHANHIEATKNEMKIDIYYLMYGEAIISGITFFIASAYFPNQPKTPPSRSASLPKINFKTGCMALFAMKDFWILLIIGSSVTGLYSGWYAVFAVNLQDNNLPLTQADCGWIGFVATIVSVFGGVVVGLISDKSGGNIKLILFILYSLASLTFIWIILICKEILPFNYASIYALSIIGGFCINGSVPLLYEIMIETTYPVPEAVSVGCLGLVNNIFTFLFLSVLNIKDIGVSWMNWCLAVTCGASLILILFFKEKYKRATIDSLPVTTKETKV